MERSFSVTLMRPTNGLPSIEVGAYEYVSARLPLVGETIPVRRVSDEAGDDVRGYVTRVDPSADPPIAVTELLDEPEPVFQVSDPEGA
jgi:hypothetical protein